MQEDIILQINDLKARVDGKEILKGINLTIKSGEIHAIMGPNGAGKRKGMKFSRWRCWNQSWPYWMRQIQGWT